jgi:predicted Zn-dependent protease with MMP-like domain
MRTDDFDQIVEEAYLKIPGRFRRRLKNVAVVVEPEPTPGQLARARVQRGGTLLGLYEGRPLTSRSVWDQFTLPDRITIFQGPHERLATSREHLRQMVEDTVWHEVAHYFGMDELRVRAAENRRKGRTAGTTRRRLRD